MHHHHAVALLVFSIVFAAFALFTLCTLVPKAHASSVVNNSPGNAQISALAGLPIRRRSNQEDDYGHTSSSLYVRDGILLNYLGHEGTTSIVNANDFTLSPLREQTSEEKRLNLYQQCAQQFRFFDPSLPLDMAGSTQKQEGFFDRLFTVATLFKRNYQSLPNACIEYYQQSSGSDLKEELNHPSGTSNDQPMGVYIDAIPTKREVQLEKESKPSLNKKKERTTDLKENFILAEESSIPNDDNKNARLTENVIITQEKPSRKISEVTVNKQLTGERYNPGGGIATAKTSTFLQYPDIKLKKRDAPNIDLLGAGPNGNIRKKKVVIDFKKAQRDAKVADLADGFLIETEYLTPGRKVIQHTTHKPGTRTVKLHFEGEKLVLDDPANANRAPLPSDAQDIMNSVLAKHDQQQEDSFINYYPHFNSQMVTMPMDKENQALYNQPSHQRYDQPSHQRYDLVKRSPKSTSPKRRSFRFDRDLPV